MAPDLQEDEPRVLGQFIAAYELISRTRAWYPVLQAGQEDVETVEAALLVIESVFHSANLASPFVAYREALSPVVMQGLRGGIWAIRRQGGDNAGIEGEALGHLRGEVTELLEYVLANEELDADVRALALRHLQELERVLRDVQIRGPEALLDALERFYGAVVVGAAAPTTSAAGRLVRSDVGQRLLTTMGHVADLLAVTTANPQLLPWIQKALEAGGG